MERPLEHRLRSENLLRFSNDHGKSQSVNINAISSVQSLSRVRLFATPWTAARQASLSITNSQNLLKLTSIESVMPSNHLILCCPLLLLPSIFPSIRVISNESVLCIRRPKYWSFSFSFSLSIQSCDNDLRKPRGSTGVFYTVHLPSLSDFAPTLCPGSSAGKGGHDQSNCKSTHHFRLSLPLPPLLQNISWFPPVLLFLCLLAQILLTLSFHG